MKFSTALTSLILIIPLFTGEALGAAAFGGRAKGGNIKGGKGAGAGAGKGAAGTSAAGTGAANATSAASAATATSAAGAGAANATAAGAGAANATAAGAGAANNTVLANNGAANNNGDAQTSLTLNPAVIAKGFANNGQDVPAAGQVASLTSTNNFINFCLTVNKPLTNGQQIKTGSCNPAPLGVIAATTNMPSSKFVSPVNGQNLQPNTAFDIKMAVNNLVTGNFVNAQENYYSAPQQVNAQGNIVGHTHFTVQAVPSFTSTTPLDPNVFAFFKGVNGAAQGGVVTESVANGLPAGSYRVCSINTDANHTPCLVAVAQHGSLDDCVYFSVGGAAGNNPFAAGAGAANGTAAGNGAGAGNNAAGAANATASAPPAAATGKGKGAASAPPAASSSAAASGKGAAAAPPAASSSAAASGKGAASAPPAASPSAAANGKGAIAGKGGPKGGGGRRYGSGYRRSQLGRDY